MHRFIQFCRNWTLPIAIVVGSGLYLLFGYVKFLEPAADVLGPFCEFLMPMSMFVVLYATFTKVDFRQIHYRSWHGVVFLCQWVLIILLGAIALLLKRWGNAGNTVYIVEAMLVCVIAPCASAAPVVTGKLGGNVTDMTAFTLVSTLIAAVMIPAVFPVIEPREGVTFVSAFLVILQQLMKILVLPLLLAMLTRRYIKPLYRWIQRTPNLAFYGWCFSLSITAGVTMRNIIHASDDLLALLFIAITTLCIAFFQFFLGKGIGKRHNDVICTPQAMFQKNTALAIWVAYLYLSSMASIGAGCYVLWQNLINSLEIYKHQQKEKAQG